MKTKVFFFLLVPFTLIACNTADTTQSAVQTKAKEAVETVKTATAPADVATSAAATGLTIYASAEETQPIQPGTPMPAFTVQDVEGETVSFDAGAREKPIMIVTYRGGWCPYCNTHLKEMREIVPELQAKGMDVYFFSGDRAEILYSGLKGDTESVISGQGYTIYSDANTEAASALGIAFKLPEKQLARIIDSPRHDTAGGSIAEHGALSVPSVFLISKAGNVEFAHSDPDYKVRLSNDELMAAATQVLEL